MTDEGIIVAILTLTIRFTH